MSSNVQLADEELDGKMRELLGLVENVKKAELMPQKKEQEAVARTQFKQVRSCINSFRAEVKRIEDPTQKSVFSRKLATYEQQLKTCDQELKLQLKPPKADKKPKESKESQLMGEGGVDGSQFTSTTQVLAAGQRLNQDAMESLGRSERLVNSAEETGRETLTTLQKQTEVVNQVDTELAALGNQIERAKKDVMWFARQMAGDKCFLMLFLLIVVALLILVFWKVYDGRTSSKNTDTTPAPTPEPTDVPTSLTTMKPTTTASQFTTTRPNNSTGTTLIGSTTTAFNITTEATSTPPPSSSPTSTFTFASTTMTGTTNAASTTTKLPTSTAATTATATATATAAPSSSTAPATTKTALRSAVKYVESRFYDD